MLEKRNKTKQKYQNKQTSKQKKMYEAFPALYEWT